MRSTARHWVELGEKIYAYRRDVLTDQERNELGSSVETVKRLLKEKADAGRLKLATEALEEVLRHHGGKFYPRSVIQEYVEFFVVAAIVLLGLRAYYFQPFKIPTNSMWPTYYGMTPEIYPSGESSPNAVEKAARFVLLGATHYEVTAPKSGKVYLPVIEGSGGYCYYQPVKGRKWLILPNPLREYTLMIDGDTYVKIRVPEDFDFASLIRDTYGLSRTQYLEMARQPRFRAGGFVWVELPKEAVKGQPILNFDLLTGDQLVVDRVSYHFIRPKVGEGFVFRTGNIEQLSADRGDQYYIKRLAGVPGDTLEIREPTLYRNGSPITGADAFDANAKRKSPYTGYVHAQAFASRFLGKGDKVEVPPHRYFALGDNSSNSLDSRFWGFVPYKDVIGRPLFIYYPFSRRFGPAK
ncbi:MAG: signal peptidase I [Opitutaceae bacterium]|nr:signal peptidase I [Opitutaceae bacterium]